MFFTTPMMNINDKTVLEMLNNLIAIDRLDKNQILQMLNLVSLSNDIQDLKDNSQNLSNYPKNLPVGRPNEFIPAKHLTVNWGDFELLEITE